ncbi:SMI1/KNR4 family protein [Flammeovirga pacifica]|uniref:Knr4/Smi1-like domain-containing protein n=1 Tax=Flammeovirga pacifica TaxID=915059 RepID=A0A1S1YT46_FLAPC|nr:SMI1/KNR4 family protein [Flammeovirga pacifica]OHX64176.1 hypothetical protein NH26_21465 [Flammeovirga pacifica]
MKNNLNEFYNSIISFLNAVDNSKSRFIKPCKDQEIELLITKLGFELPNYLKISLCNFGNGMSYFNGNGNESFIPYINSISKNIDMLRRIPDIMIKYIHPTFSKSAKIIPFSWRDDAGQGMLFLINAKSKIDRLYVLEDLLLNYDDINIFNPISIFDEYEDWEKDDCTLKKLGTLHQILRCDVIKAFIRGVEWKNKEGYNYVNFESFEMISWAKFYEYYIVNPDLTQTRISWNNIWDGNFTKKMQEREQQTGEILGIEAYEIAYIKYLIEEKGVPPIPHIYDPYTDPKAVI